MLFNTLTYLFFLPIAFVLYWAMRGARAKNVVILLASCVFYGWWDVRFLALMLATCVVNFLTTRAIVRCSQDPRSTAAHTARAKAWLALTLIVNFAILGTFKYFNFFAQSLSDVLSLMGCAADMPTLDVLLPVGISFYTFQLSGYAIDHYRQPQEHRFLLVTVTDPRLLERTGGIVQGMSGSPILQDGKLIGAVTHVLVNDPTRGYGISIQDMLSAA